MSIHRFPPRPDPTDVAASVDAGAAPVLAIDGLTLTLPRPGRGRDRLTVLRDCNLDCRAGEITALVGASGAGKSLLALAVLGLLPRGAALSGRIAYRGRTLDTADRVRLRGRSIAYLPQGVQALDPSARSDRHVLWSAHRAGYRNGTAARLTLDAMDGNGIAAADRHLFPHELSGGMARRVLGAAATVGGADLILADEPTTGLDPVARDRSLAALRALADSGRAVLAIGHDLAALVRYADRLVTMREGETLESCPADRFAAGKAHHAYSRALWAALPENGLGTPDAGWRDAAD